MDSQPQPQIGSNVCPKCGGNFGNAPNLYAHIEKCQANTKDGSSEKVEATVESNEIISVDVKPKRLPIRLRLKLATKQDGKLGQVKQEPAPAPQWQVSTNQKERPPQPAADDAAATQSSDSDAKHRPGKRKRSDWPGTRLYECFHCDDVFRHQSSLDRHVRRVHPEHDEDQLAAEVDACKVERGQQLPCNFCQTHFGSMRALLHHVTEKHKFRHVQGCTLCPQPAKDQGNGNAKGTFPNFRHFLRHMRQAHEADRPDLITTFSMIKPVIPKKHMHALRKLDALLSGAAGKMPKRARSSSSQSLDVDGNDNEEDDDDVLDVVTTTNATNQTGLPVQVELARDYRQHVDEKRRRLADQGLLFSCHVPDCHRVFIYKGLLVNHLVNQHHLAAAAIAEERADLAKCVKHLIEAEKIEAQLQQVEAPPLTAETDDQPPALATTPTEMKQDLPEQIWIGAAAASPMEVQECVTVRHDADRQQQLPFHFVTQQPSMGHESLVGELEAVLDVDGLDDEAQQDDSSQQQQHQYDPSKPQPTFACLLCTGRFYNRTSQLYHIRKMHNIQSVQAAAAAKQTTAKVETKATAAVDNEDDEQQWACAKCHRAFRHESQLRRHEKRHAQRRKPPSAADTVATGSVKCEAMSPGEHSCMLCGRTFMYQSELDKHIETHLGLRRVSCKQCGLTFSQRSSLRLHKRLHSNKKPHECTTCGKGFYTSSSLKVHINLVHLLLKPYTCTAEGCDRTFGTKCSLNQHLLTHTGEKAFPCAFCGKSFSLRTHLSVHSRTWHPGEDQYMCPVEDCRAGYLSYTEVNEHCRREHDCIYNVTEEERIQLLNRKYPK